MALNQGSPDFVDHLKSDDSKQNPVDEGESYFSEPKLILNDSWTIDFDNAAVSDSMQNVDLAAAETTRAANSDPMAVSPNLSELFAYSADYYNSFLPLSSGITGKDMLKDTLKAQACLSEVDNCESYSTRYTDSALDFEQLSQQISSMNLKIDGITETMLKQLDEDSTRTPLFYPNHQKSVPCIPNTDYKSGTCIKSIFSADTVDADLLDMINQKFARDNLPPLLPRKLDENTPQNVDYNSIQKKCQTRTKQPQTAPSTSRRGVWRTNKTRNECCVCCCGGVNANGGTPANLIVGNQQQGNNARLLSCTSIKPMNKKSSSGITQLPGLCNNLYSRDIYFTANQVRGQVAIIAKDQAGCRLLQKQLDSMDEEFINAVLYDLLQNLCDLMTDPFGNYLCQKLMSVCNHEQLGMIIRATGDDFIKIGLNMHGTRAVQKLVEVVTRYPDHVAEVTGVLTHGVVDLVNDLNGNHVIQKCLASLTNEECEFIYKAMNENCVCLATHRHGCCVMQRCIDAANQRQRLELVDTITSKSLELVEDAYGNYVIQYVLRLKIQSVNRRIVNTLADKVTELAKQKFSSNVVERCLIYCCQETRSLLIKKFLEAPSTVLKDLILDPFGNYVIQRILNVSLSEELTTILEKIYPHLEEIKVATAGKRIAAKITKRHYCLDDRQQPQHCNHHPHRLDTKCTSATSDFSYTSTPVDGSYSEDDVVYRDNKQEDTDTVVPSQKLLYNFLRHGGNKKMKQQQVVTNQQRENKHFCSPMATQCHETLPTLYSWMNND